MHSYTLSGLAQRLVNDALMSNEEAHEASSEAANQNTPLVRHLVGNKILDARDIAISAANEFGTPVFDLDAMDMEMAASALIDEKLIRKHNALPLTKRGNRLYVALSDPTNLQALDEIKFATGISTEAVIVEDDKLARIIEKVLEAMDTAMEGLDDADLEDLDISGGDEEPASGDVSEKDTEDAPIVRFVNKLLLDAINKGASDLHFEPYEKAYRVRFRVDGMLHEVAAPPVNLAGKLAARIKVMSRLDISEKRVPQDGRMKMKLSNNRAIDFRVSTCPTLFGEKIVMRILDPTSAQLGIDALGYDPEQKRLYMEALHQPYGMILVTGPTGSGKTVSLYTGLNILNTPERNISTA